jgi:capsular exopolysaccharide synthesis family protein
MNNMEKYHGELIERSPMIFEPPPEPESGSASSLLVPLLRRWYIVVLVFFVTCAIGIPAIWLLMEPRYEVTGAIRVAPILSNILTGEADRGEISNYQYFMNTQAEMVLSSQVVQRVADDLSGKHLAFFEDQENGIGAKLRRRMQGGKIKPDSANILKQAIYDKVLTSESARNSELVKVTMTGNNPDEAKKIVDAFIQTYMLVEVSSSLQGQDQKLTVLENERKVLASKLESQRQAIQMLGQEYGSVTLTGRYDMMLGRVSNLLMELTKTEAQRINLEAKIQMLEQGKVRGLPDEMFNKRSERINNDPTIQEISRNVVRLEEDLIASKQLMTPDNPLLKQKEEFLDSFRRRVDERRQEISKEFDTMAVQEANMTSQNELLNARAQLEQISVYESRLKEKLAKEDTQTVELGRKQLAIEEMKEQLASTKERYDAFGLRIQELEMERKRPARVTVAYSADIAGIQDKRIKLTFAIIFGALACGVFGAIARDKLDSSLHTPDDVVKCIGIRLIGTTTSPRSIDKALLSKQMAEDYQTIRANIGLLDGGGMPKKLAITSPGMKDGKTTFAINLATSLSRSGKKVLLIDGDLRKPDIGRLLSIPRESRCLKDVLLGNKLEDAVVYSNGLYLLASDSQSSIDPYELLASPRAAENINKIAEAYDHVIIDTPPVLAFPDALLWAKMTGAVILTGFAGQTTAPDLKETRDRLIEIGVKILGTVLSNVPVGQSYYRYGYDYYSHGGRARSGKNDSKRHMLLPMDNPEEKPNNSVS